MAPANEPIVAYIIVPNTFISVITVSAPPESKTTSDGIGGKMFSIYMSINIAKYP
jgi:hypothetical protein